LHRRDEKLHPTFSQKNEVKIPFGRPSPRCSWEETDKNLPYRNNLCGLDSSVSD
jgi:hypothetical protein